MNAIPLLIGKRTSANPDIDLIRPPVIDKNSGPIRNPRDWRPADMENLV
jgi:hypothetical protein